MMYTNMKYQISPHFKGLFGSFIMFCGDFILIYYNNNNFLKKKKGREIIKKQLNHVNMYTYNFFKSEIYWND